jgi:hypothetical protein
MSSTVAGPGDSEALREGVHVRRVDRDPDDAGVDGSQGTHEARAELRVMVADQHVRCLPVEGGVARLLRARRVGGRVRHRGINDRASPQVEKKSTKISRNWAS